MSKKLLSLILSVVIAVMLFTSVLSVSAGLPPYFREGDNIEDMLAGLSEYSAQFPDVDDYSGESLDKPRKGCHLEHKQVFLPVIEDGFYKFFWTGYGEASHDQGVNYAYTNYYFIDENYDSVEIQLKIYYKYNTQTIERIIEDIKNEYDYYIIKDSSGEYEYVGYDSYFHVEYYCSLGDKLLVVKSEFYLNEDIVDKIKFVATDINLPVYVDGEATETLPDTTSPDEETTEPPSTGDEEPQRLLGDVDNDGKINVKDATAVQKHIAGIATLDEVSAIYADADRSGEVSIEDATAIQKYVADLDNETSIGIPYVAFPETYRYYFYLPKDWLNESTSKTGNTAGIYWWDETNPCLYWPGIPAKKADAEGVYYYDVPKDVTTIIWNNFFNGGSDTSAPHYHDAAQTTNIGAEYYEPGESDFYPDGTENFDGMIYVVDPDLFPWGDYSHQILGIGEWFYYYGNGEYGTSKVRGESKILSEDTVDLSRLSLDNEPVTINRYYFYLPEEWLNESTATTGNTAGIYWWDGTGAQDKYPGKKAEKADAEGVYYCDVPSDVWNIMWNNYFDGGEDIFAPYYPDAISCRSMNVEFYWPDESELYPDGLESFDGMIYVIDLADYDRDDYSGKMQFGGEWFYYYGNGEYGTAPVRGESEILTESALNRDSFVIG